MSDFIERSVREIAKPYARFVPISYRSLGIVLGVADVFTVLATSILSGGIYHLLANGSIGSVRDFAAVGILVATLYCTVLSTHNLYDPVQILNKNVRLSKLLLIWIGIFAVLAVVAFTAKVGSDFSRGAELSFCFAGFPAVVSARWIVMRSIGKLVAAGALTGPRTAVIFECKEVGDGTVLNDLRRYGYMILKSFPVSNGDDYAKAADKLIAFAGGTAIDEVLLLVSWHRRSEIDQILTQLRRIAVPVRLLADQQVRPLFEHAICRVGTALAVELRRVPLTRFERAIKRSFDVLLASVALIVLAPMLMITAFLIRLDSPGPSFFLQRRVGFNGQPFSILKFRTMSVLENGSFVKQAVVNDHRVTRLGRWLRRSSIDELPQLLNVLYGQMSLVGPRPHAEAHDIFFDAAVAQYAWRRNVKPGITGWAQVNGSRGETPDTESVRRRVDYDVWYVENWSLWLDLRILVQTLPALFVWDGTPMS